MLEAGGAQEHPPVHGHRSHAGLWASTRWAWRAWARSEDVGAEPVSAVHDVKNLFVMDALGFPSSACQNPTLTIMALAVRSCDFLMEQMKQGTL